MRKSSSSLVALGLIAACGGSPHQVARPSPLDDSQIAALPDTEATTPAAAPAVRHAEDVMGSGEPSEAKRLLIEYLVAHPTDARALFDLGLAHELMGAPDDAEASYRSAIQKEPGFALAYSNLGALLHDRHHDEAAIDMLQHAVRLNDGLASAHATLALCYEEGDQADLAEQSYKRALAIHPHDATVRVNLGLFLLAKARKDDAVRELRTALADAGDDRSLLISIGNGLRRAGEAGSAVRALQHATEVGGAPSSALLSELALAQFAAGDRGGAESTLARVLLNDGRYATAHFLLGKMLAARGAFREAIPHYQDALRLEPNAPFSEEARRELRAVQAR